MLKSFPITLAFVFGAALFTPQAGASVILSYNIAAVSNPASVAVASVAAGATASSITRGDGLSNADRFPGTQGFFGGANFSTSTTPVADDYFQFSIQPNAGQQITYGSLTYGLFREIRSTALEGVSGPAQWDLVYSLDGFSSAGTTLATLTVPTSGVNNTLNQVTFTTDIRAIGTQSGPVSFRWYGYEALRLNLAFLYAGGLSNASGSGIGRNGDYSWTGTGSNVFLDGTVTSISTVPEPASLLMVLTALGLAVGCGRIPRRIR